MFTTPATETCPRAAFALLRVQHFQDTGEVRILDQVKEVVALHKDRHVFPVEICVTKLSGVGADQVFLGMLRNIPFSKREIKARNTRDSETLPTHTVHCIAAYIRPRHSCLGLLQSLHLLASLSYMLVSGSLGGHGANWGKGGQGAEGRYWVGIGR